MMGGLVYINGSPKTKDSTSALLINQMEKILGTSANIYQAVNLIRGNDFTLLMEEIEQADAIVIAFPLYVDSVPAPLIKLFSMIEEAIKASNITRTIVYAICNCGFHEAEHTTIALEIVENFVHRSGFAWGYGIGIGGGGIVATQKKDMAKGIAKNVYFTLQDMSNAIQSGNCRERNVFVTPKFPRFLYKLTGDISWKMMARKNGVGKNMWAKPHHDVD